MENDIPWNILEQVFSKMASQNELVEYDQWLLVAPENEMIADHLREYYCANGSLPVNFTPNLEMAFTNLKSKIKPEEQVKTKRILIPLFWKIAAVFLLAIVGWWTVPKTYTSKMFFAETTTADSVQTNFVLADGTHVWLNYGSELKYSKHLGKTREVYLTGEAYFEVAHDSLRPFIVNTGNTHTTVLGTKFNVNSYSGNTIEGVTVTDGKVSFGTPNNKVFLLAGNCGVFNKQSNVIEKSENTNSNFLSWKTKEFKFKETPLDDVFSDLAKVYRFQYEFKNAQMKRIMFSAHFNSIGIDNIMEIISITTNTNIKKVNQIYIIQ